MKPIVHWLEGEFWGEIDFIYLDQYDSSNRDVFDQYGLRGRPIFLLLDADGQEVQRWFGFVEQDVLQTALNDFLTSNVS